MKEDPNAKSIWVFSCLGRDSNPHGRFGPRDFLTTMAFATVIAPQWRFVRGLDYSFTIGLSPRRCVVSSLCTFLLPEAWLKIACRLPTDGFP